MAIHPNEMHFYREQQKIIADNRAREQQKIHDFETFRQRQREEKLWAERAAYVKRVTTPPKISKVEPRVFVPGHAPGLRARRKPTGRKQQGTDAMLLGLCRGFLCAHSWVRLHGTMRAYAAIVVMPWFYASAFNRALISLGVAFGLSVNLAVWVICGIELLVLCRVGKWIAAGTAACMAAVLVLPVAMLEAGFDALFRKKSS